MLKKVLAASLMAWIGAIFYISVAHAEIKVTEGAAFRLRQEIWDDVVTLDTFGTATTKADRNFFRLRTSIWGKVDFDSSFGIYLKLTNEAKYYGMGPFRFKSPLEDDKLDPDELVFDNLYVDAKDLFGLPVDIRIGRQDFLGPNTYGEGFLLMDGTPGDGSRTFYFNAAKVTVKFDKQNSIDFVYINDPATDTFLASLHPAITNPLYLDNKRLLTASREQAYMAYARTKPVDGLTVEPYYIYKIEGSSTIVTPELKLNTVGGRAVFAMDGGWNVGGEYAYQFGEYSNGNDRRGNGGYVFVGRKYPQVALKPEFDLRYVYLSGDDPNTTTKNKTWDPLFSRNPYWNELLIYSLPHEQLANGGPIPGYWTNMQIAKATIKLNFDPDTSLALAYQYLWAPEKAVPSLTSYAPMFGTGKSRGHLPTAMLSHVFSKNVDGYLQLEYFIPGSFYSDEADNALFFRWQLQIKC